MIEERNEVRRRRFRRTLAEVKRKLEEALALSKAPAHVVPLRPPSGRS